jgi:hypothetical protein
LYDDADVERLLLLRGLMARGYAIGQVAGLSESELAVLAARKETSPPSAEGTEGATDRGQPLAAVFAAVQSLDSLGLDEELGRLATLLNPVDFVHQVALPLMREVGERWHRGAIKIAHEHMVTESLRNLLGAMSRLNRPAEAQVRMLVTTPTDEFHEIGVLASAMLAGTRGFRVTCLGPNLPANEILFAAEHMAAQVVLLGLTSPQPLPPARDAVREVALALPADTELWLAGTGANQVQPLDRPGTVYLEDFHAFEQNLNSVQRSVKVLT